MPRTQSAVLRDAGNYSEEKDSNLVQEQEDKNLVMDNIFSKGQSKRIWGELYKVRARRCC
jgi:hypothetical protein